MAPEDHLAIAGTHQGVNYGDRLVCDTNNIHWPGLEVNICIGSIDEGCYFPLLPQSILDSSSCTKVIIQHLRRYCGGSTFNFFLFFYSTSILSMNCIGLLRGVSWWWSWITFTEVQVEKGKRNGFLFVFFFRWKPLDIACVRWRHCKKH